MDREFEFAAGQIVAERYQLLSRLGSGGMGTVWRARHVVQKSHLALKLLNAALLPDVGRLTERFMREAKAVSSLDSPHLVRVLDYGVDAGVPYIAMELLEGDSLAQRLRSVGRLSPGETACIIRQVASGLSKAHEAGIVHRDIKPANIVLCPEGVAFVAKLLDFGIAKTGEPTTRGLTLTETGTVLGTPHYMSPEQVQGARHIDQRSDLWSLAVIAFECLTGVLPFRGESLGAVFIAICVDPPPLPSAVTVVPPGFDEWFAKGVSRDPGERFQSADELAASLAALSDAAELLAAPPSPGAADDQDSDLLSETVARSLPEPLTLLAISVDGEPQLMHRLGDDYPGAMTKKRELVRLVALGRGGMIAREALGSSSVVFHDAGSALRAAVELQEQVSQTDWPRGAPVQFRMALDTCQRAPTETGLSPLDLRRAQTICSAGHGGQILVSQSLQARLKSALPQGLSLSNLGQHQLDLEDSRPQRLFQLVAAGLAGDFAPLKTPHAAPNNLPVESTEFVGRIDELQRLSALCSESRLVTLVGPGGTGKSRLAVRTAGELAAGFSDGTFFVPLAAIRDPDLVVSTIAGILGVVEVAGRPVLDLLLDFVQEREVLLVLDNFEQVLPAAANLSRLLEAAPRLKLLVTSRVVLHLTDEKVFQVPPLSLPEADARPETLRDNEAVALFVSRARRIDPSFELGPANAGAIAEIVGRVEGLPLAIELAAARTRLFSTEQLARQLREKQTTLHDGSGDVAQRHRGLRQVVAWSYELLNDEERALFRRLAVFVGSFGLESADRVTAGRPLVDVAQGLASLIDKSLLRREIQNGLERLVMLECIREFAEEELEGTDEGPGLRRRHAQFFRDLATEVEPELKREGTVVARDRLAAEEGNLRAALDHYLRQGDANAGLELAASIWRYWQSVGRLQEGRRWLAELLARPEVSLSARARGLTALAGLAYWQADYPTAISRYRDALEIYRELGDRLAIADTLFSLSTTATWSGDSATGEKLAEEALEIFEELGAREQIGMVKMAQGFARWMKQDLAGARPLWESSIEIAREVGDNVEAAHKSLALASITFQEGKRDQAIRSSLEAMNELYDRRNVALTVMAIDWIAAMIVERSPEDGTRLAGASAELRGRLGGGMRPEACGLPNVRALASQSLGPEVFKRAYDQGRRMDLAEAVELARGVLERG